jgi:hypothetical protein
MVTTTRSAKDPYNPWIDFDENGIIGLTDLVALANSYGTSGDTTKNVTVTNMPLRSKTITIVENYLVHWDTNAAEEVNLFPNLTTPFSVQDFNRIKIYAEFTNYTDLGASGNYADVAIVLYEIFDFAEPRYVYFTHSWQWNSPDLGPRSYTYPSTQTTQTLSAPQTMVGLWLHSYTPSEPRPATIWCTISLGIYLIYE